MIITVALALGYVTGTLVGFLMAIDRLQRL
jgi:hypothetical protein